MCARLRSSQRGDSSRSRPVNFSVRGFGLQRGAFASTFSHDACDNNPQPGGKPETLIRIPVWDYNWQEQYELKEPLKLPKGTILKITAWHDNTASNKANPDPTQWVGWGQRSYDDMYHAHVNITYLTQQDYDQIVADRVHLTVELHREDAIAHVEAHAHLL